MQKQAFSKLMVAILLMVFVFALGNLVFNLENLYIGEEKIPEFINPGGGQSQNVATIPGLADALRWVYFGFLVVCGLAVVVGAASFGASKDKKKWKKLFFQILAVLLIVGMLFAFAVFYPDIKSTVFGGGYVNPVDGSGDASSGNDNKPPTSPDTLKAIITFGVFAIIFMFCIVVFIAVNNMVKMRSAKLDYSDIEKDTQEVAQTIQRTIDALAGGSDTRATVIRCYTDMCKVMSKYGVQEEEYLTPREFQKLAVNNLPVPEEQMRALVDIFEEARYSKHTLGETDSQRAVMALEAVRVKLLECKPAMAPEEAKPDGL
jgi:uncharacterized membrane protein HdeD (DUF308 family)